MIYWIRKFFSDAGAHGKAFAEVFTITTFSLLLFIAPYMAHESRLSQLDDKSIVDRGQFFLLTYAIFGTIFWLAFVRWDRPRHNARVLFGLIATIAIIPIVAYLGVDPTFQSVINPDIVRAGYWYYGGFMVIHYLLLFYSDVSPPDIQKMFKDGAQQLTEEARRLESPQ